MSRKIISCEDCDAEFTVRHTMSDRHYQVKYCVFCGSEIPEDNEDDLYDEEEDYWKRKVRKQKVEGYNSGFVTFSLRN